MSDVKNGKPEGAPRPVPILEEDASDRASSALAVRDDQPMVLDIRRALPMAVEQFKTIREFVKDVLVESKPADEQKGTPAKDGDYGTVPGIAKPFLFKSGAEKIAALFGYAPVYVTLEKVEDFGSANGFFFYRYRCDLISKKSGVVMGSGIGSCNSKEDRYRWTNTDRVCPNCGKSAIIKGRTEYGGGWLCFAKKGGCGNKWPDGAKEIEGQSTERVEREAFSLVNTIDKMAQKRALVAAVLIGTGTSALFTQDEETVEVSDRASTAKPATVTATSKPAEAKAAPASDTWRPANGHEFNAMFRKPDGKNKKGVDLPKGCRWQKVTLASGKDQWDAMVDSAVHGPDTTAAATPLVADDIREAGGGPTRSRKRRATGHAGGVQGHFRGVSEGHGRRAGPGDRADDREARLASRAGAGEREAVRRAGR
jgi:hypothetical protein